MKTGLALENQLRRSYERPRIDFYQLTHHACRRMLERKIHADWVREALLGDRRPGKQPNTVKCLGPFAMATINIQTREIITVGYGLFNNPTGSDVDATPPDTPGASNICPVPGA